MRLFSLIMFFQITWALLLISAHLALIVIVYRDAKELSYPALGISPFLWATISFCLPIIGMFIYWIMNHSSLSRHSL